MGGEQSRPAPPPPIVIEDPYPDIAGADGISLSQAVKCTDCDLQVDTNISVASVKLKRELGDIQASQCAAFANDKKRVEGKFMSLSDFLFNLQSGKYSRPVSEERVDGRIQGYCETVTISDEDAAKITSIGEVDAKLKGSRIRRVTGAGGFSSGTKARFIPSIPFKMSFAGNKVIVDARGRQQFQPFKNDFTVNQLVVYHPSPVRVDGVQADAILSLNDPSDSTATGVVLVPLRGTNSSEGTASFLNKLVQNLPSVQEYDPESATYPESTVQTGADWTLGRLFTLDKTTGTGGTAGVKNGFFTWTGVAGYERVKLNIMDEINAAIQRGDAAETARLRKEFRDSGGTANISGVSQVIRYSWRPLPGFATPQYYLLDSPLEINRTDLALITGSLTPTPAKEAIHPIPAQPELVFHKGSVPPAPDTISGSAGCGGVVDLCEGFTTGTLNDQLKASDEFESSCPGAKCDPFLQNVKELKSGTFTTTAVFTALFNALVFVAMAVGAYIALNMVGNDYDIGLRNFAEAVGKILAVWAKGARDRLPALPAVPAAPAVPSLADVTSLLKRKA